MTVDQYLKKCTPKQRAALGRVRKVILKTVPGVTEKVAWQVPYYSLKGTGFIAAFAARAKAPGGKIHPDWNLSLLITPKTVKQLAKDLKKWDVSGGAVHFTPEHQLPETLLRTIIRARLARTAKKR